MQTDEVATRVRQFYEACSFPGYEDVETPFDLAQKAGKGIYMRLLDEQIPWSARIVDVGCGTGQLVNFLSAMKRNALGIDLSFNSLRKGRAFKERFELDGARFVQMDIFRLALRPASFDFVFSNGVLHHTADARGGFREVCQLAKRGGYVILGLYNPYGRLMLNVRKALFRVTGGRFLWLDFVMRQNNVGAEKKRIWFADQYRHPHEAMISVETALEWFRENGLEYLNSVPKVNPAERLTKDERLFERHDPGSKLDHLFSQLRWIASQGREGGFFILIGRRA